MPLSFVIQSIPTLDGHRYDALCAFELSNPPIPHWKADFQRATFHPLPLGDLQGLLALMDATGERPENERAARQMLEALSRRGIRPPAGPID